MYVSPARNGGIGGNGGNKGVDLSQDLQKVLPSPFIIEHKDLAFSNVQYRYFYSITRQASVNSGMSRPMVKTSLSTQSNSVQKLLCTHMSQAQTDDATMRDKAFDLPCSRTSLLI